MIEFKVSGWRSIIGEEFTHENIHKAGKLLANRILAGPREKSFVIGYDSRFLSREAANWFCKPMLDMGIIVYFMEGRTATPIVQYAMMQHNIPWGAMITASHNPPTYNGIKLFTIGGHYASENFLEEFNRDLGSISDTEYSEPFIIKSYNNLKKINVKFDYVHSILKLLNVKEIINKHLRVGLDVMYGVAAGPLSHLCYECGCEVVLIHQNHDTLFGRAAPAPTIERLEGLRQTILSYGLDCGLATDGDGDRLGVLDEQGNYIEPNDILLLLYHFLLQDKNWQGPIIRNVVTTHALDILAAEFNQKCYEVPVGFKHVSDAMISHDAVMGGESSGGLTIRGHIPGKDGIFAAGLMLELIANLQGPLSSKALYLRKKFGNLKSCEKMISFGQKDSQILKEQFFSAERLPDLALPLPAQKCLRLDGVKYYYENGGWLCLRFSNTEPLLRIQGEMSDKNTLRQLVDSAEQELRKFLKY